MTTVAQDVSALINTEIEAAYPGSNNVLGYFNAVTLTMTPLASLPTPTNFFLYAVIKTIIEARPQDQDFQYDQTLAERQALYLDIVRKLQKQSDIIDAVITAITTAEVALS